MGPLIFHVEDEMDIVWTLEYNLKREGFRTRFAATGHSALDSIKKGPLPDLVLLDVMLPDLSGTEICRTLRSRPETRNVPILMLTAREEEADRLAGFEAGADDYMVKPFSIRELVHRIRSILRRCETGHAAAGRAVPSEPAVTDPPASSPRIDVSLQIGLEPDRIWIDGREAVASEEEFTVVKRLVSRRTTAW